MAMIRQVRRSIFLIFWFLFSAVRAWPARLLANRSSDGPRVREAIMLHLPLAGREFRYGVELNLWPARARVVRMSATAMVVSPSPGAFVSRMPKTQSSGQAPPVICGTCTLTNCRRNHTCVSTQPPACTTAPPPVPPPVTTVPGTGAPPAPACSRSTINTVCHRFPPATTYDCVEKACCWNNNAITHCTTISAFATPGTYVTTYPDTYITTTYCFVYDTCYL